MQTKTIKKEQMENGMRLGTTKEMEIKSLLILRIIGL